MFNLKDKLIKEQGYKSSSIEIKQNCWVCSNVVILKGTSIGENCVIAANEVVESNIKNNQIIKNKIVKDIIY